MKILRALVHVEVPCPKCGAPTTMLASANVRDGLITNEGVEIGSAHPCEACRKAENRSISAANRLAAKRNKWATGAVLPKSGKAR